MIVYAIVIQIITNFQCLKVTKYYSHNGKKQSVFKIIFRCSLNSFTNNKMSLLRE